MSLLFVEDNRNKLMDSLSIPRIADSSECPTPEENFHVWVASLHSIDTNRTDSYSFILSYLKRNFEENPFINITKC